MDYRVNPQKFKISVILPIYKVEKYLKKCIESILNQTYKNLEIILVDDGSPDSCGKICDEYAKIDERIKVIHQENKGVSAARNTGLELATGKYIGFVDPDDFIDSNMYEFLLTEIVSEKAELSICGYDYVDEKGNTIRAYTQRKTEVVGKKDVFRMYFDMPPSIRLGVCNKLFDNNLLHTHGIKFTEGVKGAEDAEFLSKYLLRVNNAVIIHKPLYKNFERPGSATRGGLSSDCVIPALNIYLRAREYQHELFPCLDQHSQSYYLDSCLLNYEVHCMKNKNKQYELIKELKIRVKKEFPSAFFNNEIYWKTKLFYFLFAYNLKG